MQRSCAGLAAGCYFGALGWGQICKTTWAIQTFGSTLKQLSEKRWWWSTSPAGRVARAAYCSATCSHASISSLPFAPIGLGCVHMPCRSTTQLLPRNTDLTKQSPGTRLVSILPSGLSPKRKDTHQTQFFPQPHQVTSIVFTATTVSRIWSMS